jgi:hypothetical protein
MGSETFSSEISRSLLAVVSFCFNFACEPNLQGWIVRTVPDWIFTDLATELKRKKDDVHLSTIIIISGLILVFGYYLLI